MTEHLGERLQPRDVAVMIGTEDVDEPVEARSRTCAGCRPRPSRSTSARRPSGRGRDPCRRRATLVRAHRHRPPRRCRAAQPPPGSPSRPRSRAPRCRSGFGSCSSVFSMLASIVWNGIAGERRELRKVVAVIAVLGRLFSAPHCVHGSVETLHLHARVVVVVLALDLVPRELEETCNRVAVRTVSRTGDGDRPGRVRRDHLDLDALASPPPIRRRSPCRRRRSRRRRARPRRRGPRGSRTPGRRPRHALRGRSRRPSRRSPPRSLAAPASAARRASARRSSRSRRAPHPPGRSSATGDAGKLRHRVGEACDRIVGGKAPSRAHRRARRASGSSQPTART